MNILGFRGSKPNQMTNQRDKKYESIVGSRIARYEEMGMLRFIEDLTLSPGVFQ